LPLPGISIGRTTYLFIEGYYLAMGCNSWDWLSKLFLISAMIPSSVGGKMLLKGMFCLEDASLKAYNLSLSMLMLLALSALLMKVMR
jgi:hypothetical protein